MSNQTDNHILLAQIPQPGFFVKDGQIRQTNPAAAAMLIAPGESFSRLDPGEEYAAFREGQLCLTLTVSGRAHSAVVIRLDEGDLVLLDPPGAAEEFRSMALVSAQLRQPLMQAISGARQHEDPQLNRSLMQMLRMVSNMSDISRYAASARPETREIGSFLREIFEKAAALTENRVQLTFECLSRPLFLLLDPEQLERALWNILSNCVKFTPRGGTVHGRVTRQGNRLHITVEDSGSGIAGAVRADLFSRYLRQPGIEDSRHGLGLGLAIVRIAAANHGGTVLIAPLRDGGTAITLTLAIRQAGDATLRSPLLRPDYTGGFDHALVELADCLGPEHYAAF